MSSTGEVGYFLPAGPDRYTPTEHVEGAWSDREQHVSPLAGLLVHHMESHRQRAGEPGGKALSRVTFDILGPIAREEIALETTVLRPGRSVELVQTTATIAGRPTLTAHGWYLSASDTAAVAGTDLPALPDPDTFEPHRMSDTWPGGFIRTVIARSAAAPRPGRATVWVRTDMMLVGGEEVSALAAYIGLIDAAKGGGRAGAADRVAVSERRPECAPVPAAGRAVGRPGHQGELRPGRPRPDQQRAARRRRPGGHRNAVAAGARALRPADQRHATTGTGDHSS